MNPQARLEVIYGMSFHDEFDDLVDLFYLSNDCNKEEPSFDPPEQFLESHLALEVHY